MSKVYIIWEGEGPAYPEKKSKMAVPKSWLQRPVADVIELFVKSYNDKNPDSPPLQTEQLHLQGAGDGAKIFSDSIVLTSLGDHNDYILRRGEYKKAAVVIAEAGGEEEEGTAGGAKVVKLKCKNYGCNKLFSEESNTDDACNHHTGPPIFHDTMKCWSCCRERKAYDFESFQLIAPCAVGRHSTIDPKIAISASPRASAPTVFASSTEAAPDAVAAPAPAPVLKSIADYNTSNPGAATAAASAVKTVTARKSSRDADGITAKCQRKGCQKKFVIAENSSTACSYHRGQPVFHDAIKYWSCCDFKKCMDFDEFLAVPGCTVGCHDDGHCDLGDAP